MDTPQREDKKDKKEKERKKEGKKEKKEKEKAKPAEQKDVDKEKKRVAHPPAVQTILDRLVAPAAGDGANVGDTLKVRHVSRASLTDQTLSPQDRSAFATALLTVRLATRQRANRSQPDVLQSLSTVILSPAFGDDGAALCGALWEFFNSDEELRTPASALIPALLLAWFTRSAYAVPAIALEALVNGLYGVLARERKGEPLIFVAPQMTEPSVYHTPAVTSHRTTLTADALARHDKVRGKAVQVDEALEGLAEGAAESRLRMSRATLRLFSDRISLLPPHALLLFANIAHRLVAHGYSFDPDTAPASAAIALDLRSAANPVATSSSLPVKVQSAVSRRRLPLAPSFISLLLHSLVFCLDTPAARTAALAAISAVQQRASIELIPQVLVATSALQSVSAPAPSAAHT